MFPSPSRSFPLVTSSEDMESTGASHEEAPPAMPQRQLHYIIIVPFLAPGHMIPVVPSASRLASIPATMVMLASTPSNAARLAASLPRTSPVRVQPLPFHPPDHGLPDGAENQDSIQEELHLRLIDATSSLGPHLCHLLSDIHRDAPPGSRLTVLSDNILLWTVGVARKHGHATYFCRRAGASYHSLLRMQRLQIKGIADDEEFGLPEFPERIRFRLDQLSPKLQHMDGNDEWVVFMRDYYTRFDGPTDGYLINTVEDLEGEGLRLYKAMCKDFPVWPIGPASTSSMKHPPPSALMPRPV